MCGRRDNVHQNRLFEKSRLTSHDSHSTMVQDNEVLIEPSEDLAIEIYEAVKKVCWYISKRLRFFKTWFIESN